jgi:hypothetical protein
MLHNTRGPAAIQAARVRFTTSSGPGAAAGVRSICDYFLCFFGKTVLFLQLFLKMPLTKCILCDTLGVVNRKSVSILQQQP